MASLECGWLLLRDRKTHDDKTKLSFHAEEAIFLSTRLKIWPFPSFEDVFEMTVTSGFLRKKM